MGGTDLTRAVGDRMCEIGTPPAGVAYVPATFTISYRKEGLTNARFSDMSEWCAQRGIPAHEYTAMPALGQFAESISAQFCLVAGWYHLIPDSVRSRFQRGCAGLHASLLPKLRGGSPLNWAMLSGVSQTGVSLFELTDGIDDGPLYDQEAFEIPDNAYIEDLVALTESATLSLVSRCLPRIADGTLKTTPQNGQPSFCLQRTPEDGAIDWSRPAEEVARLIRAVSHPYPGAFSYLGDDKVQVWRASCIADGPIVLGVPGQIGRLPGQPNPIVVTGHGTLEIEEATWVDGGDCTEALRRSVNRRLVSGKG